MLFYFEPLCVLADKRAIFNRNTPILVALTLLDATNALMYADYILGYLLIEYGYRLSIVLASTDIAFVAGILAAYKTDFEQELLYLCSAGLLAAFGLFIIEYTPYFSLHANNIK